MKQMISMLALCSSVLLWSCGGGGNEKGSTTDTTGGAGMTTPNTTAPESTGTSMGTSGTTGTTGTANYSSTPLEKADKEFVMKAAAGGLMEVDMGKSAQQSANSQRVKDFGAMMDRDHSKANDELMALASAKGLTLNRDSLMNLHKSHMDMLKKKNGADFDKAYVKEMLEDHQKDVAEFKKESTAAKDADLKTWATNTLPVLQTHLDSIKAINKDMK